MSEKVIPRKCVLRSPFIGDGNAMVLSFHIVVIVADVGPLSGKGPELNRCFVDVDYFSSRVLVRERTSEVSLNFSINVLIPCSWPLQLVIPGFGGLLDRSLVCIGTGARFCLLGRSPIRVLGRSPII